MTWKLQEISGGGGSVRVGSVGTISSLMSRELESSSTSSSATSSSRKNRQSAPVSVSCCDSTFKLRKSMDDSKKSGTRGSIKEKGPENIRWARGQHQDRISVIATPKRQTQKVPPEEASLGRDGSNRRSLDLQLKTSTHKRNHHIPMLGSEDTAALDKTPKRDKSSWKVSLVEVVDTNCGIPAGTMSSRLKNFGFSKLSQSII